MSLPLSVLLACLTSLRAAIEIGRRVVRTGKLHIVTAASTTVVSTAVVVVQHPVRRWRIAVWTRK